MYPPPCSSRAQPPFGPFGVAVLATPNLTEATFVSFAAEREEGQWAFNFTTDLSRCVSIQWEELRQRSLPLQRC